MPFTLNTTAAPEDAGCPHVPAERIHEVFERIEAVGLVRAEGERAFSSMIRSTVLSQESPVPQSSQLPMYLKKRGWHLADVAEIVVALFQGRGGRALPGEMAESFIIQFETGRPVHSSQSTGAVLRQEALFRFGSASLTVGIDIDFPDLAAV